MNNITQIIEYRKSIIKHAKNKGVQKTLEEFKVSRATIYRWIKEYNNTGMKPLNWKSPNEYLEEYIKLTAEK